MTTENYADTRARLASLWSRAMSSAPADEWPPITLLTSGSMLAKVPPGFSPWAVGLWSDDPDDGPGEGRQVVVLPTLSTSAPLDVHRRLMARAVTIGTGRCPLCSAVAGLSQDFPTVGRQGIAAWRVLPLYVRVAHAVGCPADDWTEAERCYFLPPTGTAEPDDGTTREAPR